MRKACCCHTSPRAMSSSMPSMSTPRPCQAGSAWMWRGGPSASLKARAKKKDEFAEAGNLERFGQAGLQRQDRDAASGLVGHWLFRRDGLAAIVWRAGRLEVYGCLAREHC